MFAIRASGNTSSREVSLHGSCPKPIVVRCFYILVRQRRSETRADSEHEAGACSGGYWTDPLEFNPFLYLLLRLADYLSLRSGLHAFARSGMISSLARQ